MAWTSWSSQPHGRVFVMALAHPLAEQCTATSKRSGERCLNHVVGGGPCRMHGGNAPQVKLRREARILTAEAALETPVTASDAADVMTSAMNDAHAILQRLKVNIANGRLEAPDLAALGGAIDRAARVAKLVHDSGLEERRVQLSEHQGRLVALVIQRVFAEVSSQLEEILEDPFIRDRAMSVLARGTSEMVPRQLRAIDSEVLP